jgi:hypothetical protein
MTTHDDAAAKPAADGLRPRMRALASADAYVSHAEGRTSRRVAMAVLSQIARAARPLGLASLAARLDTAALYPPRSVGRAIGTRSVP